jgi:hypothetical protein
MNSKSIIVIVAVLAVLFTVTGALASPGVDIGDGCHTGTFQSVQIGFGNTSEVPKGRLIIENNCTTGTMVVWDQPVNLTLGNITEGEVVLGEDFVFVDSVFRPDLDQPAVLTFKGVPYVFEPAVLRDGLVCGDCNVTFVPSQAEVIVGVTGFSNYSLSGRQDFEVNSDPEPELRSKVYQTIDVGNVSRSTEFHCLVQLYGRNNKGAWVLMQTNPERTVGARILGNPDPNLPESLGYFKTSNGMANVYFDGSKVSGYQQYEYVAQCADGNSTKLIYEEPIETRYTSAGRGTTGRILWLTLEPMNAFYLIVILFGGFIGIFLVIRVLRMFWGSLRGR